MRGKGYHVQPAGSHRRIWWNRTRNSYVQKICILFYAAFMNLYWKVFTVTLTDISSFISSVVLINRRTQFEFSKNKPCVKKLVILSVCVTIHGNLADMNIRSFFIDLKNSMTSMLVFPHRKAYHEEFLTVHVWIAVGWVRWHFTSPSRWLCILYF